jgi:uncharacterized protein YjbI with pentapeptide repeats
MKRDSGDSLRRLWTIAVVLAATVGAVVAVTLWGQGRAEHRDAFDAAWRAAAAVLAVLGSFVALEGLRQRRREHEHQLVVDRAKQDEAKARQITELSAKIGDHLGNDNPLVKIGGLIELDRLGRTFPGLRQSVVDRLCMYLRTPFTPPDTAAGADSLATLDLRRTAQVILARHLHWPDHVCEQPDSYWPGIEVNLHDAILIDADFSECRVSRATFARARFHGSTSFANTRFENGMLLTETMFDGEANFEHVRVDMGAARFDNARFHHDTRFDHATFSGGFRLLDARVEGLCRFDHVDTGDVDFGSARVTGDLLLDRSIFRGAARFDGTAVFGDVSCTDTRFHGTVAMGAATFAALVQLRGTTVDRPDGPHSWPVGWRVAHNTPDDDHGTLARDIRTV